MDRLDLFRNWTPEMIDSIEYYSRGPGYANLGKTPSEATRRKMSEARMGKVHSEETKNKISKALAGRTFSEEHKAKLSEAQMGKTASIETRRKISESQMARPRGPLSEEHKKSISDSLMGSSLSEETREKISKANAGRVLSEEHKRKISESKMGRPCSEEARKRNSESNKRNWSDPEFAARMMEAQRRKPTMDEFILGIILERNFPDEWKYTGDGRDGTSIGGRNPDFININGSRLVIEVFGGYWHPESDEEMRVEHYKKHGFDCEVFWDYDVREDLVVERIKKLLDKKNDGGEE